MESGRIAFTIPAGSDREAFIGDLRKEISKRIQSAEDFAHSDVKWETKSVEDVGHLSGSDVLIIAVVYVLTNPEKIKAWKDIISGIYRWLKEKKQGVNIVDDAGLGI